MNLTPEQRAIAQQLLDTFSKRDETYDQHTEEIVNILGPTVLEAVYQFLELPDETITWSDFQVIDGILMIFATVNLSTVGITPKIERLTSSMDSDSNSIERIIRIGFPLPIVTQPLDQVIKFLADHSDPAQMNDDDDMSEYDEDDGEIFSTVAPAMVASAQSFDVGQLSKDQVRQMLYFQHQSRNTKH